MVAQVATLAPTRWRAPLDDGVGHAYPARSRGPAVCGMPNQDERFDYPMRMRCAICTKRLVA